VTYDDPPTFSWLLDVTVSMLWLTVRVLVDVGMLILAWQLVRFLLQNGAAGWIGAVLVIVAVAVAILLPAGFVLLIRIGELPRRAVIRRAFTTRPLAGIAAVCVFGVGLGVLAAVVVAVLRYHPAWLWVALPVLFALELMAALGAVLGDAW